MPNLEKVKFQLQPQQYCEGSSLDSFLNDVSKDGNNFQTKLFPIFFSQAPLREVLHLALGV